MDADAAEFDGACRGLQVGDIRITHGPQQFAVRRGGVWYAVVHVVADRKIPEHGGHAADVVGVRVAGDRDVDGVDAECLELVDDSAVVPAVNERDLPLGRAHDDRVALAHVEKDQLHLRFLRPAAAGAADRQEPGQRDASHGTKMGW